MSITDKLLNISEKYIYIVLAVLLIFPLLNPLGLPITIEDITYTYYEGIEALPSDTLILAPHDASTGTEMEIGLSSHIVIKHLFRKDFDIVFCTISSSGPPIFIETLKAEGLWDDFMDGYGTKYVYLDFIAGEEAAAASIAASIRAATGGVDYFGNDLDSLPLMQGVDSGGDFDVVVATDEHSLLAVMWMNQVAIPYDLPLYCNPLAAVGSTYWPYIDAGQMTAMLLGAKGAAGYEILMNDPGPAAANMDAQTFVHVYLLILVVGSNILLGIKKYGGVE